MAIAEKRGNRSSSRKNKAPTTDEYGHLQPQELDFEKAVLGALMIEKDAYQRNPASGEFLRHPSSDDLRSCSPTEFRTKTC